MNFTTFGDRRTASSRLRAWMIADELSARGHRAAVNRERLAPIEVLQKVRHVSRLRKAKAGNCRVIFDFDDDYLLEEVGTRDEVLAVMNVSDLVTVGSPHLLEIASAYHDNVRLFENPLDVDPSSAPRGGRPWGGKLGWFGNRTNLGALEEACFEEPVTTVTSGGDIEWDLETIDSVLTTFDLVVIPSASGEWARAKNANRALKCIALGVPVLVSATPEQRRALGELGLPDWFLVSEATEWTRAVARVRDGYAEALSCIATARQAALARHGREAAVDAWLEAVNGILAPATRRPVSHARPFSSVDVVLLCEGGAGDYVSMAPTLRRDSIEYKSVTAINPHPLPISEAQREQTTVLEGHDDFFDIYGSLSNALGAATGSHILVLRAGVQLQRGFFAEAPKLLGAGGALEVVPQLVSPNHARTLQAVKDQLDLLATPRLPFVLMLPTDLCKEINDLDAALASLALWELSIQLTRARLPYRSVTAPLATLSVDRADRHTINEYAAYIRQAAPDLLTELPHPDAEWRRLKHTMHADVVERHREVFAQYLGALLPRLDGTEGHSQEGVRTTAVEPADNPLHRALGSAMQRGDLHYLRTAVRMSWRASRGLVPEQTRARYYRKYRGLYEAFFPERRPRRPT